MDGWAMGTKIIVRDISSDADVEGGLRYLLFGVDALLRRHQNSILIINSLLFSIAN